MENQAGIQLEAFSLLARFHTSGDPMKASVEKKAHQHPCLAATLELKQ